VLAVPTNRVKPSLVACPICRRRFDPLTSRAMPFCSERCRLIDLGRWLGEEYHVPAPKSEEKSGEDEE
jgi:endogenous inhibitor of DNA gyrase (YacG/DUF329 family)